VVAPGVEIGTAEPGTTATGAPRYGTVNGSSAAAAIVAGDAALVAQARPDLDAESLKGVLVGAARSLGDDSVTAQGAGLVDVGGAAATELTMRPAALALGRATSARWHVVQRLQLHNVPLRRVRLRIAFVLRRQGAAALDLRARPNTFFLGAGRTINVHVRARVTSALDGNAPAEGFLVVHPTSGLEIRVPWVVTFGPRMAAALSAVRLSSRAFRPSDVRPPLLSFVAGSVPRTHTGQDVRPVSRLDLELWSATGGRIGVLATMRDVLPGHYSYGVTGRDPTGQILPSGNYSLRVRAYPMDHGPPTVRTVGFRIK
jgi:hypothetical protein